jgi:hypothetical protein
MQHIGARQANLYMGAGVRHQVPLLAGNGGHGTQVADRGGQQRATSEQGNDGGDLFHSLLIFRKKIRWDAFTLKIKTKPVNKKKEKSSKI